MLNQVDQETMFVVGESEGKLSAANCKLPGLSLGRGSKSRCFGGGLLSGVGVRVLFFGVLLHHSSSLCNRRLFCLCSQRILDHFCGSERKIPTFMMTFT